MNFFNKNRGFTLIEIVIVIGIMAFFSAIIYSSFDTSRAKSRDQKRVSDISLIQLALEQYFQKYGVYPTDLQYLVDGNPDLPKDKQIKFLPELPKAPSADEKYSYFPITKTKPIPNSYCVTYQLWTKFELINQYLGSKKGFNSKNLTGMDECKDLTSSIPRTPIDASADQKIYDVMP